MFLLKEKKDIYQNKKAIDFCHYDFVSLKNSMKIKDALRIIRLKKNENKIVYYYVVDEKKRIIGVLPLRTLISARSDSNLGDVCRKDIVTVNENDPLIEIAEKFYSYKFLSMPVVDNNQKIIGVIDVKIFMNKDIDLSSRFFYEEIFQTVGIRLDSLKKGKFFKNIRIRLSWLLTTIASGFICAVFVKMFSVTITKAIVLTFFISLVLALGESMSVQSLSIIFPKFFIRKDKMKNGFKIILKEIASGFILGILCALIVGIVSFILTQNQKILFVTFFGVAFSMINASIIGSLIPVLLNKLKLDPKIASGPLVLAITDVSTVLIYLISAFVII